VFEDHLLNSRVEIDARLSLVLSSNPSPLVINSCPSLSGDLQPDRQESVCSSLDRSDSSISENVLFNLIFVLVLILIVIGIYLISLYK
jgi:hypothetical protein